MFCHLLLLLFYLHANFTWKSLWKLDAVSLSAAYWKIVSQRLSAKANATAKKTRRQIYVLLMFVQRMNECVSLYECVFAQVNNKITSRLPGKLHKKKHGKSAERAAAKGKQHALLLRVFLCWHTWSCLSSAPPLLHVPKASRQMSYACLGCLTNMQHGCSSSSND